MELALIVTVISLILTVLSILDKLISNRDRVKREGAKQAITETDVSTIKQGNASILVQLDKMDNKMDNFAERLVRVEESAKSAHKRIDNLEGRHGA